jgi:hypothetical protein
MCYTSPTNYDVAHISPIRWERRLHIAVIDTFKYTGGYLTRNGRNCHDINSRILSDGNAFGALRIFIFSSCNILSLAKRSVYASFSLSILLYGSECWSLTNNLLAKHRVFHNQFIRKMYRVTKNIPRTIEYLLSNCESALASII